MSFTLCTKAQAVEKAGANANAAIVATALTNFSDDVEAQINAITRQDWVTAFATAQTNFKNILTDLSSDMIALKIISYDPGSYNSLLEAATIADILKDNIERNLRALKEINIRTKIT